MKPIAKLITALMAATILTVSGCGDDRQTEESQGTTPDAGMAAATQQSGDQGHTAPPGTARGTVVETMDSGGYTYVKVDTGSGIAWAAANQFQVAAGDIVSFPTNLPMKNYHSKTLDRTFDVIYFTGNIKIAGEGGQGSRSPHGSAMGGNDGGHGGMGTRPAASDKAQPELAEISKAKGGWTVEEIYRGKAPLSGSEILVRGQVVKSNSNILGTNWYHIQDGTGSAGTNDLTVTSTDQAKVGQVVLVRGRLNTDRDFGSGYFFDVIVEEATLTVE